MKNSKFKKALALGCATAMALSVNAFALPGGGSTGGSTGGNTGGNTGGSTNTPTAGATTVSQSMDYDTVLQAPTIEVELTANNAIVMNPYGLTFTNPLDGEDSTDSIATAVNVITSKTLAPLDVDVTVTSQAPEGVSWGSSSVAASTDKEVFLQLALEAAADDAVDSAVTTVGGSWTATTAANMVVKNNLATAKAELIVLDGTTQAYGEDEYFFIIAPAEDADTPAYAHFQLVGDLATKSDTPWTAADAVDVSVAFTFNIMSNAQLS